MPIMILMLIAIVAPPVGLPLVLIAALYIIGNHVCIAISTQVEEFDELHNIIDDCEEPHIVGPVVYDMCADHDDLDYDTLMAEVYNSEI